MHSKSFRCHTMYPTCCYSIPLQAQKGSPNSSIWERRKLGLTKEGLNDFPEGSQSLALASSHYPLPPPQKLCCPPHWGRAPAGWESLVLDGWSPVGSVVRFCSLREGEECSHPAPGRLSGAQWSSLGAVGKELPCKEFCFASGHFSICPE